MNPLPGRRRRSTRFYLFAHTVFVVSLLGLVSVYILWSLGLRPGGFERHLGSERRRRPHREALAAPAPLRRRHHVAADLGAGEIVVVRERLS